MASTWANGLPRVTPERGSPKRVTFIYPYYMNFTFLGHRQCPQWNAYPAQLREYLSLVIVDDGSPDHRTVREALALDASPFPVAVFRIQVDVPWNWLAARNIGAKHAPNGWIFLTDMDHVVPEATAQAIVYGRHDPVVVYAFSRREHTGEVVPPHSASFLMTRQMFWKIGGYDETLSGHYGTDGEFRRRLVKHAPIHVLTDVLERYEYVGDSSTSRYPRKLPADAAAVKKLVTARGKNWTPKVLSFPYEEVSC